MSYTTIWLWSQRTFNSPTVEGHIWICWHLLPSFCQRTPSSIGERCKKWKAALLYYLAATGITAVHKNCATAYCWSWGTRSISYIRSRWNWRIKEVLKDLDAKFSPKVNIRYERFVFRQTNQEFNETIDPYVTRP